MRPRHVVIGAAALLGLLHPANAEAWVRMPLVTVLLLLAGAAIVLLPSRRTMIALSSLAVCLVGWALLAKAPEQGPEIAYERAVEAGSAVAAITRATLMPWKAPIAGIGVDGSEKVAVVAILLAVIGLAWGLRGRGAKHTVATLAALGLAFVMAPAALGHGRLANGVLLGWSIYGGGAYLVLDGALAAAPSRRRTLVLSALSIAFLVLAVLAGRRTWTMVGLWRGERSGLEAILAEQPKHPRRIQIARRLLDLGNEGPYLEELARSLNAGTNERVRFTVWMIENQKDERALGELKTLGVAAFARDPGSATAAAKLLDRTAQHALLLDLGDLLENPDDELRLKLAQAAMKVNPDRAKTHIAALLEAPRPSLETLQLAHRSALARDPDFKRAAEIAHRAIDLYPKDPFAYIALGKAAKVYRRDDEMIGWYEKALALDVRRADIHFDLGLVYHGRADSASKAAYHYAKVLEIEPEHKNRSTIEAWIASLSASRPTSGGGGH